MAPPHAQIDVLARHLALFFAPSVFTTIRNVVPTRSLLSAPLVVTLCDLGSYWWLLVGKFAFPQHPGVCASLLAHSQKLHQCTQPYTFYHPQHRLRFWKWATNANGPPCPVAMETRDEPARSVATHSNVPYETSLIQPLQSMSTLHLTVLQHAKLLH